MTDPQTALTDETGRVIFRGTLSPGGGSMPDGILASKDYTFTEEATAASFSAAIVAASPGDGTFSIAGDHTSDFFLLLAQQITTVPFAVRGSTANDGLYTISSFSYDGTNTVIGTNEGVPDATADGTLSFGIYTAAHPVLAGSVISDITLVNESGDPSYWSCDAAILAIGDTGTINGYYSGAELTSTADGLDNLYTPAVSSDFTAARSLKWRTQLSPATGVEPWRGPYGDFLSTLYPLGVRNGAGSGVALAWAPANAGAGLPYHDDDTISMTVISAATAPPVTPSGLLRVKIEYFTPITAVAASFA